MNVVKKNLFSIIFGVIALLAVVAIFWPIEGMYADLDTNLKTSYAIGGAMDSVGATQRLAPLRSPFEPQEKMDQFPNQHVIELGVAATVALATQSNEMLKAAVDANIHAPTIRNSLPPIDANKFEYTEQYLKQLYDVNNLPDARWRPELHAGIAPTVQEIEDRKQKVTKDIMDKVALADQATQQEAVTHAANEAAKVKANMELDVARSNGIYLQPNALTQIFDPSIGTNGRQPANVGQVWDAQIYFWIIDDMCHAIERANANGTGSYDVLHAPVKQIVSIDRPTFVMTNNAADLASGGEGSAVPIVPAISATGHVSNAMYDVYRYTLVLKVDASKVNQILKELEINQFITVLNVQRTSLDTAMEAKDGFMLGDKPVEKLDILCEEMFLHSWMDQYIPDERKGAKAALGGSQSGTFTPADNGGDTGPGPMMPGPGGPGRPILRRGMGER